MQDYKKLRVWQMAIDLCIEIYEITKKFPAEEKYGITSQLRRASVSVGANIAEGSSRRTKGDFRQFLYVAIGSLREIETMLLISKKIGYIDEQKYSSLESNIDTLARMMNVFIQKIEA